MLLLMKGGFLQGLIPQAPGGTAQLTPGSAAAQNSAFRLILPPSLPPAAAHISVPSPGGGSAPLKGAFCGNQSPGHPLSRGDTERSHRRLLVHLKKQNPSIFSPTK